MKKFLYLMIQITWGFPQTLLGFLNFILTIRNKHYFYNGAIITVWKNKSSVSLGLFVFITDEPFFYDKLKSKYTKKDLSDRLLVHEYGHTIQSLILGPLYLFLIGIPSTLWGFLPNLARKRQTKQISYFSFFTEKWANVLGEKVTKKISMENLIID